MSNPVWRAFVAHRMEDWLDFFNNNHIESYIRMIEQFIRLNPYFVPTDSDMQTDSANLLNKLLWNDEFNESLSKKGMMVFVCNKKCKTQYVAALISGSYEHERRC